MALGRMVVVAAAACSLSACGTSGSGGTSSGGSGSSSGGTGGGGGSTGGATATVTITGFAFSPDPLKVAAGTTITFVNKDGAPHTATSEAAAGSYTNAAATNGFKFDTGTINSTGGTATVTVPANAASGTSQPYYCTVHKSHMTNPDPVIQIQ